MSIVNEDAKRFCYNKSEKGEQREKGEKERRISVTSPTDNARSS